MTPRRAPLSSALLALALSLAVSPVSPGSAAAQSSGGGGEREAAGGRAPVPSPGLSFGPLTSQEAAPLQRLGFTPRVEGADLVGAGAIQSDFSLGYANIFEQDSTGTHDLLLDLERLTLSTGLRWGAGERVEVGGRLSFETTGGGILDGFVSAWHARFGLSNGHREKYPQGAYEQTLRDGMGRVRLDLPRRTMALEDVRLFAKWEAWRRADGGRLVSVRGVVRVPTEADMAGERRTDVALMALARSSWTRWHLHALAGASTVRAARDYDGMLRRASVFADVAVERSLASWVSGVAQLSVASPRLQGFDDSKVDGWPVNLVLGLAGRVGNGWRVDVSFQEDVPPNTPAVDFTLGVGVRRSW